MANVELRTEVSSEDYPAVVKAWFRQLLDPQVVEMVRQAGDGQVEIRLAANRGRVRSRPVITIHGGSQAMVEPEEVMGNGQ